MIMRKILFIVVLIIGSLKGYTQVYEVGVSYNVGQVFGEVNTDFSLLATNVGVTLKKNMNPRMSYRLSATRMETGSTSLTEITTGIDFNFNKFNLVRTNGKNRSTPYVILEVASLFYNNEVDNNKFTMALPFGVGFKKSINRNFNFAIEAKARVAFTDKLDTGITDTSNPNYVAQNTTTLDGYYYTGVTLFYTFGWPRGSKNQIRF